MLYLWGRHAITGRWQRLQGPCDASTLAEYQRHFATDTLSDAYAHVAYSGFAGSARPLYSAFKTAAKAPRA
jgi:hypothetical protein